MDPVTMLLVSGGLGLAKAAFGGAQIGRGSKMRKNNQRPDYEISDEYYKNVGMYEEMAQGGLPQDELTRLHQQATRGLTASLSAGLQMGADANTVNDYYQSYLDNNSDIGVKNTLQRFSNMNLLANSRNALAEQKFIEFSYDKDQPYKDTAQAATAQISQGVQNVAGGIDQVGGAVAQYGSSQLYKSETDRLLAGIQPVQPVVDRGTTTGGGAAQSTSAVPLSQRQAPLSGKLADPYSIGIIKLIQANPEAYGLTKKQVPAVQEDFYYSNLIRNGGLFGGDFLKY